MNPAMESLSTYQYNLPPELIASVPLAQRDQSRLMVIYRRSERWEHRSFRDFPGYFDARDLVVANHSRVMRARLKGYRLLESAGSLADKDPKAERTRTTLLGHRGGKVEFLLVRKRGPQLWEGLLKSGGRVRQGFRFFCLDEREFALIGEVVEDRLEGSITLQVRFNADPFDSQALELPIPPYLRRSVHHHDFTRYQTIYAQKEEDAGSVAAPTAGLHFTPEIRTDLAQRGVSWAEICLHVGPGTFRPVQVEDISQHSMHAEVYGIHPDTAEAVTQARRKGNRITAIGSTSLRTLETAWDADADCLHFGTGETKLFVYPADRKTPLEPETQNAMSGPSPKTLIRHELRCVDQLMTNFHLPGSTLLMLVCAVAGKELVLAAYHEAIAQRYRFFSYGDAMLILNR